MGEIILKIFMLQLEVDTLRNKKVSKSNIFERKKSSWEDNSGKIGARVKKKHSHI
jgi:hypothetical protein